MKTWKWVVILVLVVLFTGFGSFRIKELERRQETMWNMWKLANTHEIKQDEIIAELEYQIESSEDYDRWIKKNYNKLFDRFWENRELISLLMDHLNLEEKFISEHMELVPKTGN